MLTRDSCCESEFKVELLEAHSIKTSQFFKMHQSQLLFTVPLPPPPPPPPPPPALPPPPPPPPPLPPPCASLSGLCGRLRGADVAPHAAVWGGREGGLSHLTVMPIPCRNFSKLDNIGDALRSTFGKCVTVARR